MDPAFSKCELCGKHGTPKNKVNRHHVRGRKQGRDETGFILLTHSKTCHLFAQWLTNLYLMTGKEAELSKLFLIYMFGRITTLRDGGQFILPEYQ